MPHATVTAPVSDSALQRLEEDTRAAIVAASFLDVSGAAVSQLVQGLDQVAGDPEQVREVAKLLADLERSRGFATEHILQSTILVDCNLKLVRRAAFLASSKLSEVRSQQAFALPFVAQGGVLFPDSIADVVQQHLEDQRRASEARLVSVVANVAQHIGSAKAKGPKSKAASAPAAPGPPRGVPPKRGGKAAAKRARSKGKATPPAAKAPRKQP